MRFADITQGRVESDVRMPMARVVCTVHPAGAMLETHAHDAAYFTLVLAGDVVEDAGGVLLHSRPGSLLFRPAFEPHRNRYGRTGCRSVLIELALAEPRASGVRLPHAPRRVTAPGAIRLALEISGRADHAPLSGVEADNGVLELVALAVEEARRPALRRGHEPPVWLRGVYDRITDMPRDVPSIATLANVEGVDVDHLIRMFRAAYGETPGLFARRQRARAAARQIRAGSRPLASVAAASGYADQSHMTRELRRFLHTTPGAIRRSVEASECTVS